MNPTQHLTRSLPIFAFLVLLARTGVLNSAEPPTGIESVKRDLRTGTSQAVIVGKVPLVHTHQVFDPKAEQHPSDYTAQVAAAFQELAGVLESFGSHPARIARLNVYVKSDEVANEVREMFSRSKAPGAAAMTFARGNLARPERLVALDAIATANDTTKSIWSPPVLRGPKSTAALVQPGRTVYIAGQAEKKPTLREATQATLEGLRKTLQHYGLGLEHVVQIKSFMTPIASQADVEDEIARFFGEWAVPPLSFVEWQSTLPIEIELIASAPFQSGPGVEYSTPPGMVASPIYSRVAIVNSPKTIYIAGLYGPEGNGEIRGIFTTLADVCREAGSDLKHLVKATYYVGSDDASSQLNAIRPEFYDPQRPPSASKALVRGVGLAGRSITIDMIAVPIGK